jgi:elongation factor P
MFYSSLFDRCKRRRIIHHTIVDGGYMITANDLRQGKAFEYEGELYVVTTFQHIKPGKGSPFVRIKMRSIKTNSTTERTFRPDEKIVDAYLEHKKMQYLYKDNGFVFMNLETYEQITLPEAEIEEESKYLLENALVDILFYGEEPIGLELPTSIELKIIQTDPGFKGDTATGGSKPATLETGLVINVPLFIEEGERIRVDTRSGDYIERVSGK